VLAGFDAPAYIRRARQVQDAFTGLIQRARVQRDEWLKMARTRLGLLHALAGDWPGLRPLLADDAQVEVLQYLLGELKPRLRARVAPTTKQSLLRQALERLCESLERFNRRWEAFLPTIDLTEINSLREGYNRWYLLEKECAVGSSVLASRYFQPLAPLTLDDIARELPLLPIPRFLVS
jgi:hypothetical protein